MPTYEYMCKKCGPFTQLRPMAECELPSACPECGTRAPRVLLTAPGCLLGITWVGLSPTDRASFAWRLRRVGPRPTVVHVAIADCAAGLLTTASGHERA